MNSDQYTNKILRPGLVPFTHSLSGPLEDYEMVDDGHKAHTSRLARSFAHHRASLAQTGHLITRPHGREELIAIAQEEWGKVDWVGWINQLRLFVSDHTSSLALSSHDASPPAAPLGLGGRETAKRR